MLLESVGWCSGAVGLVFATGGCACWRVVCLMLTPSGTPGACSSVVCVTAKVIKEKKKGGNCWSASWKVQGISCVV